MIFNDEAFKDVTDRQIRSDHLIALEHGKPLIFGKERNKGIRLKGLHPEVVTLGEGVSESDLVVHDEANPDPSYAFLLSTLDEPNYPVPVGTFRNIEKSTYDQLLRTQIAQAKQKQGEGDLRKILFGTETWTVV